MEVRSSDAAVVASELQMDFAVRPARHDRVGQRIERDRDVFPVRHGFGDHAAGGLEEEQVHVDHPALGRIGEDAFAAYWPAAPPVCCCSIRECSPVEPWTLRR